MKYNRVLLKLSGESLMGSQSYGIDPAVLSQYASDVKEAVEAGVEVAIVIGGGNIFRGLSGAAQGMDRVQGDYMGMMATLINSMALQAELEKQATETPYGVPYRPSIWGAGWDIQRFGFEYYFLANAFPDIFTSDIIYSALDFVLGCHPGSNTASFASGVGAESATVAYGLNRADWSYIPGGVVSGTALIRPDFPELLEFPFLWQQTEYVLGGGSSHYMFLVLAAKNMSE